MGGEEGKEQEGGAERGDGKEEKEWEGKGKEGRKGMVNYGREEREGMATENETDMRVWMDCLVFERGSCRPARFWDPTFSVYAACL